LPLNFLARRPRSHSVHGGMFGGKNGTAPQPEPAAAAGCCGAPRSDGAIRDRHCFGGGGAAAGPRGSSLFDMHFLMKAARYLP
ncbi:MAG: hypothetical protein WBL41_05345, partial [Terracidiphilus sp.]